MSGLFPKKGNDVQATSRTIQKGGSAGSLFGGKSSSSVAPSSNNAITVIAGDANNPQTRVLEILGRGTTEITGTQNGMTTTVAIEAGQGFQGGHIVMAYQDSATAPSLPLTGQVVWTPGDPGTLGTLSGPDAGDWSLLPSETIPSGEQRWAIIGYYDPAATSDIQTWLRVSQETVDGKSLEVGTVSANTIPYDQEASVTITQDGEVLNFVFNIPAGKPASFVSGNTTDTDYAGTAELTVREINDTEFALDARLRAGPTGPEGPQGPIGAFRSFKTILDTDTDTIMVDTDYDAGSNIVFVNGVFLDTDEYTFTAPRTFTFNPSLYDNDDITIQNGTTGGPQGPGGGGGSNYTAGFGIDTTKLNNDSEIAVDTDVIADTDWVTNESYLKYVRSGGDTDGATAVGEQAFAVGPLSSATMAAALAVGPQTTASNFGTVAVGLEATASSTNALAIGGGAGSSVAGANASGNSSIAIGSQSITDTDNAIAIGRLTRSQGFRSVAIGDQAEATHPDAIAIGDRADAKGNDTIAIGDRANADTDDAIAIGRQTVATGANAIAVGEGSQATMQQSIAIGDGAMALHDNSIAVGFGATTDTDTQLVIDRIGHILTPDFKSDTDKIIQVDTDGRWSLVDNAGGGSGSNVPDAPNRLDTTRYYQLQVPSTDSPNMVAWTPYDLTDAPAPVANVAHYALRVDTDGSNSWLNIDNSLDTDIVNNIEVSGSTMTVSTIDSGTYTVDLPSSTFDSDSNLDYLAAGGVVNKNEVLITFSNLSASYSISAGADQTIGFSNTSSGFNKNNDTDVWVGIDVIYGATEVATIEDLVDALSTAEIRTTDFGVAKNRLINGTIDKVSSDTIRFRFDDGDSQISSAFTNWFLAGRLVSGPDDTQTVDVEIAAPFNGTASAYDITYQVAIPPGNNVTDLVSLDVAGDGNKVLATSFATGTNSYALGYGARAISDNTLTIGNESLSNISSPGFTAGSSRFISVNPDGDWSLVPGTDNSLFGYDTEVIISSSGSWTKPAGVTEALFWMIPGGVSKNSDTGSMFVALNDFQVRLTALSSAEQTYTATIGAEQSGNANATGGATGLTVPGGGLQASGSYFSDTVDTSNIGSFFSHVIIPDTDHELVKGPVSPLQTDNITSFIRDGVSYGRCGRGMDFGTDGAIVIYYNRP